MSKITGIIPTCNRAHLLATAIKSVLSQTFQDFELIIVDDCSSDNPGAVVKSFPDARIRYIRHEARKGGSGARNTGIVNSNGQFIAFLDDDDEWLPEKLAKQVAILEGSDAELGCVYTGYTIVNRGTGEIRAQIVPTKRGDLSHDLLVENPLGAGGSSVLLKRECFDRIGMFDEQLPCFQDYDFWIRLSKQFKFDFVTEPLVKNYMHEHKIWTNTDAIRKGADIMVRKYGESNGFRKRCSLYYLAVAVQLCERGERTKARDLIRCAISLDPYNARHYMYFVFSLLTQHTYQKVQRCKAHIMSILHRTSLQTPNSTSVPL